MESSHTRITDILDHIRALGDDHSRVEAKRAREAVPRELWQTISAFANASGGTVLLGIDQRNNFEVVGVADPPSTIRRVTAICTEDLEPPVRADITALTLGDKVVVEVVVPPAPRSARPCYRRHDGPLLGSRVRVGDANERLTEYEVTLLLSERTQPSYDRDPVAGATMQDLDHDAINRFVRRIRMNQPNLFGDRSDDDLLRMCNVVSAETARPTLAGVLAFGRYPQQFFPQLNITVVVYPGPTAGLPGPRGERFLDNRAIDGSVAQMLRGALAIVQSHMKRRGILDGLFRREEWEYPVEVIREAVVNALVHRDYSPSARGAQVQIEIYPDRLLIRNPGGLYGPVDVTSLGLTTTTSSRNQALLRLLEDAEAEPGRTVCENRGSGIAAMRRALAAGGMEPPQFSDLISTFELVIANHVLVDQHTLEWLEQLGATHLLPAQATLLARLRQAGGTTNNSGYRTITGVQDSRQAGRELRDLVNRDLLVQIGDRGGAVYRLSARAAGEDGSSSLASRILATLGDRELSRRQLAEMLDADPQKTADALVKLRRQGLVVLVGVPRSRSARWRRSDELNG